MPPPWVRFPWDALYRIEPPQGIPEEPVVLLEVQPCTQQKLAHHPDLFSTVLSRYPTPAQRPSYSLLGAVP